MKSLRPTVSPANRIPEARLLRLILPTLFAILLWAAPSPVAAVQLIGTAAADYRADRVLVRPKPGVDLGVLSLPLGITLIRQFPDLGNLQVLHLPPGTPVLSVVSYYRQSGLVDYAEPDYLVHLLRTPNDFRYFDGSLWGLHNTGNLGGKAGADIKAPDAWDLQNTADGIVVAVVDTGVRLTHEDVAANLWTNPGETGRDAQGLDKATNGIDDDGDGYVDDVHGINTLTGSGDPSDDFGHGTHVNGIIGGVGNNSVGVVGVAWRVQLMNCKFIDAQGNGSISDAVTCIDYARSKGARTINASWGSTDFQSAALRDAIAGARDAGILFVAAAGNSHGDNDANPLYPASYDLDNIVSVASTNRQDNLSFFSNFGATTVDLAAPGEDIFSCWNGSDSDYEYASGTSMAAGFVSGAAAILMAHSPGDNYAAIKRSILEGVEPLPALQGRVASGGRLDLFASLGAGGPPPPTVPAAPSNMGATATSSSAINLRWSDNADNEDGFRIERSTDNSNFTEIATVNANATSYTDNGLSASTRYYYRVRAFNSAGNSDFSNTADATTQETPPQPPTVPAAPSNLGATATSSSAINLRWSDNSDNEDGFRVERSTNNSNFTEIATVGANATSYTDNGLSASTRYFYRVRAFNTAGNSDFSNTADATTQETPPPPPTVPAAPSNLGATATSSSAINLRWSDNADNEDGFRIERSTNNANFTEFATVGANATSYTDNGLSASTTYYYRVRAFNSVGNSGYSNTASAATQAPPPPPEIATVTVFATGLIANEAGTSPGEFTIRRSGSTAAELNVQYSMGGTAGNGRDYQTLSGLVTIPAGAASVKVRLVPIDDREVEAPELAVLSLAARPGYRVGTPGSAAVTILDNDLLGISGLPL
ncbi:MAG: S8 family serine peptidase [Opitutae bacterium]|nr:S8 family serine peptidase [Opitutae bacterium]